MSPFYLVILLISVTLAAVPHSKEREADGAFSPRDHGHHGENHENAFDHEAILGIFFPLFLSCQNCLKFNLIVIKYADQCYV